MASKKYKKAFVDKYIKNLKMDYKKSKVWQQLDEGKKQEIEDYLKEIEVKQSNDILSKLNLELPKTKGRNKEALIDHLKCNDNTEASLFVLEDLQKKGLISKNLTEYKEQKYYDTISRVLNQLNLSSLSNTGKYQNKKIMNTLDFMIKTKYFGSKLEKEVVNCIETNLSKEDRDLIEGQHNSLKFKHLENINYALNKRGIVELNKDVNKQSLIKNNHYYENISQNNWNNYLNDLLDFGNNVGLFKYKDTDKEYLIAE